MRRILVDSKEVDISECSFAMPWRSDSVCYGFKFPTELIKTEDVDKLTDKQNIESLVIGCPLSSYDFISNMENLTNLYIYNGENLTDISFIRNLLKLDHLYIAKSHISDLEPLDFLLKEKQKHIEAEEDIIEKLLFTMSGISLGTDCSINDPERLFDSGNIISELLINGEKIRKRKKKK